jgi:hypothetical protein
MTSSVDSSSWPVFTEGSSASLQEPLPSTTLDFITSVAACDIAIFDRLSYGQTRTMVLSGVFATV